MFIKIRGVLCIKSNFRWQPCLLSCRNLSWTSSKVRSTFTDFFSAHGHEFVPSSSVIPKKGEGTYFTNAGMNQFKPIFLGEYLPTSQLAHLTCATNSQKCIRVGGKHNDLDDVGHDLTHHTFFEMLGSWSFGNYFKKRACSLAFELLTDQYGISPDRLYFTYFAGDATLGVPPDEECKDVWLSLGVPEERVLPFGEKDNFWCMGETGPCGPCTEIHYDHIGQRLAPREVNAGSPALVEIWNLVFMQYNRLTDGSLQPLPARHVDTGMGLERLTALLNNSTDNYSTDLFLPLFDVIAQMSKAPPYQGSLGQVDTAYRILADHTRMITVAISDGLLPSNDNLGHKLRSILHRCIDLSRNTFRTDPCKLLPALVNVTVDSLSCAYPELLSNKSKVCSVVSSAIEFHDRQREAASRSFEKMMSRLDGTVLSGEGIQALEKGHYGSAMSLEVISDLASSRGLQLDLQRYEELSSVKKVSNSRVARPEDSVGPLVREMAVCGVAPTVDVFKYDYQPLSESLYDFRSLESFESCIQGLSSQGEVVDSLSRGEPGEIVLDRTCFYAEGGGQEADSGQLVSETGKFVVTDTKNREGYIIHCGRVIEGHLLAGQDVESTVYTERREGCMRNHTATHLLNTALETVVPSSQQEGSSITPYKLTFDFLALGPVKGQQIDDIEKLVRNFIKSELDVGQSVLPIQEALSIPNIRKLQNEVYPDTVSVISVGQKVTEIISAELCGGTHVANTSHLLEFCVTQLSSKSQNVKRITCVTGREAQQALLSGKLLTMVSDVLQSVNLQNVNLGDSWGFVTKTALELLPLIEARQERLQHSLQCLPHCDVTQQARLNAMLAEANKSQAWVHSVLDLETVYQNTSSSHIDRAVVSVLTAVVGILKKGKDLELMQKSAREKATHCLQNLEHKVTEVSNEKMLSALCKCIESTTKQYSDEVSFGFFVPKDFAPRQMVKVFQPDWKIYEQCAQLSLVHFGKKAVTVVHGRERDNNNGEGYSELLARLHQVSPTKGKQISVSGGKMDVFMYTMNSRSIEGHSVDQNLLRKHLHYHWVDVDRESNV